jgi:ribosomal protein S18 acetylase RimI-like enzyme
VSQKYLTKFLGLYKTVFNYVDERNTSSAKWLESLGFTSLHREPKYGIDKVPFNLYIKDKDNV